MNERNAGTGPKRWVSAFFVPRHILFINLAYKKNQGRGVTSVRLRGDLLISKSFLMTSL